MSSFQDKAQVHISQIDKEVCIRSPSSTRAPATGRARWSFICLWRTVLTDCIVSFPSILSWTTWRSRPPYQRSTLFSGLSRPTSSSSSSTSVDNSWPMLLDSWSRGTTPSRPCSVLARVTTLSGLQYAYPRFFLENFELMRFSSTGLYLHFWQCSRVLSVQFTGSHSTTHSSSSLFCGLHSQWLGKFSIYLYYLFTYWQLAKWRTNRLPIVHPAGFFPLLLWIWPNCCKPSIQGWFR